MKKNKWIYFPLFALTLVFPLSVKAVDKKETIYTNLDENGKVYKTNVTNHLSNFSEKEVKDETTLKNILNINGEESFTLKDGSLNWQSNNKDIFYKGDTDKKLPISVNIKYYLNDKERKVKDMVGKKGKVKIIFSFLNHDKKQIDTGKGKQGLYTPFIITMGTLFDNKDNRDFTITNGKIVNTGTRSMLISIASPGLNESLNTEKLDHLNEIQITYKTDSFSLNNIYMAATPKLINDMDLKIFDKMDKLYQSSKMLEENMDKLEKGTLELEKGALTLTNGSKTLKDNLQKASVGVKEIKNGSMRLDVGLKEVIKALENAKGQLENNGGSLKELETLKSANQNTINSLIIKSGKTLEELKTLYENNSLNNYGGTDQILLSIKSTYEMIGLLSQNNMAIDKTISTMTTLSSQISGLLNQLSLTLTQLEKGASTLHSGTQTLYSGISQLYEGSIVLENGTQTLYSGAQTLHNGTTTFNKNGIKKLSSVTKNINIYEDKVKGLVKLSKDYKGFSSSNSNSTLFIYMIKSVK